MELLALGVAPAFVGRVSPAELLAEHAAVRHAGEVTLAERDVLEPLDRGLRASIARRLLEGAGFELKAADGAIRGVDPLAITARLP